MDGVLQLIGSKSKPQHGRPITKRESCQLRPPLKVTIAIADGLNLFSYCLSLPHLIPFTAFSLLFLCHLNLNGSLSSTFTSHWLFLIPHLSLFNPLLCLPFSLHPLLSSLCISLYFTISVIRPLPGCLSSQSSSTVRLVVTLSLSLIQLFSSPALRSALSLYFPFSPNLLFISLSLSQI